MTKALKAGRAAGLSAALFFAASLSAQTVKLNPFTGQLDLVGAGSSVTAGSGLIDTAGLWTVDTAIIQSRATAQAGTSTYCRSTTGNATYTCSLTPALTAYTTGGCLTLNANFANVTTATINVDTLGAKSILNRAGSALAAGDITADRPITICYDGTQYIIQGDGGGGATPTLVDVYWPFGPPTGSEIAFNPGATVVKAYSFTPTFNMSFTKIAYQASGVASVAFSIYTFAGSTRVTNSTANCANSSGSGNGHVCSFAGTVTLTAGTTYRFAFGGDAATGIYVSNGGTIAYNTGSGSGFAFSSTVAIGTAANVSTGSGGTLALPATTGSITAVTGSITANAYPMVAFIP
ncbi:MAG: hypothetical protein EBR82_07160 [Caulobacteraceae bacterium]|nr:hypothetical protein [Caulobacteraceae bacterium]